MILNRRCHDCGVSFEVLVHNGERVFLSSTKPYEDVCLCGSTNLASVVGVPVPYELGDEAGVGRIYPYYDRALNAQVHTAKHRRQLMAQRGLVDGGDVDLEAQASRERSRKERIMAKARAHAKRYDEDPAFADFRRLQDRGWFEDMKKRDRRR